MAKTYVVRVKIEAEQALAPVNRITGAMKAMESQALASSRKVEAALIRKTAMEERAAVRSVALAERTAAREAAASEKMSARSSAALARKAAMEEKASARSTAAAERTAAREMAATARREARDAAATTRTEAREQATQARKDARVTRSYTREEAHARAKVEVIRRGNDKLVAGELKLMGVTGRRFQNGWEGADKLLNTTGAMIAGYASLNMAVRIIGSIGDAARDAAASQDMMTDSYIRYRDMQREQADMRGIGVNKKTTLQAAEFEANAGMNEQEAKGFTTAFYGSGAQHEKKFGKEEMDKYKLGVAKLAMTTGIDPTVMANLGGAVAGEQDFANLGKEQGVAPSRLALAALNQKVAILQSGSGDNNPLVENLRKFTAYSQSDKEGLGTFSGVNAGRNAAAFMSMAAESSPSEPEVFARNAVEAIRNPKIMKAAGITPQMDPYAAYEKLAPFIVDEAKTKGIPIDAVLAQYKINQRAKMAAAAMITKGVEGGGFADRKATGDANATPEQVEAKIDKAYTDPQGPMMHRLALAQTEYEKKVRGEPLSTRATLMEHANARMIREKTETSSLTDHAYNLTGGAVEQLFGGMPSLDVRQTEEMKGIVRRRAKMQGINMESVNAGMGTLGTSSAEGRDRWVKNAEKAFEQQGGRILQDLTRAQLDELKKLNAAKQSAPPAHPVGKVNTGGAMAR